METSAQSAELVPYLEREWLPRWDSLARTLKEAPHHKAQVGCHELHVELNLYGSQVEGGPRAPFCLSRRVRGRNAARDARSA